MDVVRRAMLEKIAVACGLANIYLTVRQNIWCWPVGVVMVSLYIYIFFDAKLYSDARAERLLPRDAVLRLVPVDARAASSTRGRSRPVTRLGTRL